MKGLSFLSGRLAIAFSEHRTKRAAPRPVSTSTTMITSDDTNRRNRIACIPSAAEKPAVSGGRQKAELCLFFLLADGAVDVGVGSRDRWLLRCVTP